MALDYLDRAAVERAVLPVGVVAVVAALGDATAAARAAAVVAVAGHMVVAQAGLLAEQAVQSVSSGRAQLDSSRLQMLERHK